MFSLNYFLKKIFLYCMLLAFNKRRKPKAAVKCSMELCNEWVLSLTIYLWTLQFRENVAAWSCFYDRKDVFTAFLERVLQLKEVCIAISFSFISAMFFG